MKRISISCAVVMLCLFPCAAMWAVDGSMVLHFTFDEGKGDLVADDSLHSNNGRTEGNPKWVPGKFGSALEFDGNGETVEISHAESLNISTAVTMEMWVKIPPSGGESNQAGIEKGIWDTGEYSLYPVYGANTIAQFNDLPEDCDDENTGRSIRDNQWHHLAGVWDGHRIYIYLDGELDKSSACEGELGENKSDLYIGSRAGNERFLIGTVDEVRIYNRALTQAEIKIDMVTFGSTAVSPSEKLAVCWGGVRLGY